MDLLIAANTVTQAQADTAPVSGTPGWATDGNPATGLLATDAPAWHYNMMMAELIAIIKAAGMTSSNTDWSQVLKAMQTIFAPAQYGVAPYSKSLAQLIGGYPLNAVVADSTTPGTFWVSTADANVSIPGADGATWQSLFNGYATQAWAQGLFATLAQLVAETTRATTIESNLQSSKANRAGGNSWSGTQNFGDDLVVASGYKVSITAAGNAGSCYMWPEYYASGNLAGLNAVTHVLNSSGNSLAWLALNDGNGRLYTSTGSVAFLADMPNAAIINSSNPNATGVSGSLSFTAARSGFLKLDVSSSNSSGHKVSTASVSGTGYTSMNGGYNAPEDMLAGSYIVAFAAGAAVTINVAVTYDGTSSTNYLNATGVIVYNA